MERLRRTFSTKKRSGLASRRGGTAGKGNLHSTSDLLNRLSAPPHASMTTTCTIRSAIPLLDYVQTASAGAVRGYGETDNWPTPAATTCAESAHQFDRFTKNSGTRCSPAQVRDQTTFIITPTHGRGSGPVDWRSTGRSEGMENMWIASSA